MKNVSACRITRRYEARLIHGNDFSRVRLLQGMTYIAIATLATSRIIPAELEFWGKGTKNCDWPSPVGGAIQCAAAMLRALKITRIVEISNIVKFVVLFINSLDLTCKNNKGSVRQCKSNPFGKTDKLDLLCYLYSTGKSRFT